MTGTMSCSTKMINAITVRFIRPENAKVTDANPIDDAVKISNVGINRYQITHKTAEGYHATTVVSGGSVFRWFRRAINNMIVDDDAFAFMQIDWILFPAVFVSRDHLKQNDVYSSILDTVEFHLDNWPGSDEDDDRSDCCGDNGVIAEFYFNYPFDYSEEVPEIDEDTASESSDSSDDSDATEEVPVRRSKRIAKKAPVSYSDSDSESDDDSEYTESESESESEDEEPTRRSKRLAQKPHVVYSEISDDEGEADAAKIRVHTFYGKNGKEVKRHVYDLRGRK